MKEKDNACVICCEHCGAPIGKHFYNEGWEAKQLATQRTVMEALWAMLSSVDDGKDGKSVWSECDDCLDTWEKCNIHPHCKAFCNSTTLDEFITAITEVDNE